MQNEGVEVSVSTVDIAHVGFDARRMVVFNGVIEHNINPVKLSDFR